MKKLNNKKRPLFILYSDIHHNIWASFNENNRRLDISKDFEKLIFRKAQKLRIPILFSGDLLHLEKGISNLLLSIILPHYKNLSNYDVRWYGISGNHDQSDINLIDKQSPSYVKTFSSVFDNFSCIDFGKVQIGNVVIHGVPYITHDQGLLDYVKSIDTSNKAVKHVLMLHTTLPGTSDTDGRIIQTNTIGKEFIELVQKKFKLIITGHIHKAIALSNKIIQVGATNQQRKTDRNSELGYWIIYDDLSYRFKPVNTPKFVELPKGEKFPDKDNFYYHAITKIEHKDVEVKNEKKFKDINNKEKLAKTYLKEKGINDKVKKAKLVRILNDTDNDSL